MLRKIYIFILLLLLFSPITWAKERVALVIGNTTYQKAPRLPNAINDAEDMAEILTKLEFEVILATDLNRKEMLKKMNEFGRQLGPNTVGLFYYAGHALQMGGKNYLTPVDASIEAFDEVQDESISVDRVLNKMSNSKYKNVNIIILDACRDNPYKKLEFFQDISSLGKMKAPENFLIIYATTPDKKAADGNGKNGLFTKHLIKHMRLPHINILTILPMVRKEVIKESEALGYKQVPWEHNSLVDDFCFVSCQLTARNGFDVHRPISPTPPSKPEPPFKQPSFLFEPEMVFIPKGVFMMGCDREDCDEDEQPRHPVAVNSFYIGKYAITFNQWDACVKAKACSYQPSDNNWGRDQRPVTNISWNDTKEFIEWLRKETKKDYRLPTEAEWEYAARGQTKTVYPWGDTIGINNANCDGCGSQWDNKSTAPVDSFSAHGGLYSMYGNVWEWVQDCYHKNYKGAPNNSTGWETNCYKDSQGETSAVLRGGSWYSPPDKLRATHRIFRSYGRRPNVYGFRIARSH